MAGDNATALFRAFLGRSPTDARDTIAGAYLIEGLVHSVDGTGVKFTLPTFDGGQAVFGPAPYDNISLAASPPAPATGARCLIAFVGGGMGNPWVLATWPNPGIG